MHTVGIATEDPHRQRPDNKSHPLADVVAPHCPSFVQAHVQGGTGKPAVGGASQTRLCRLQLSLQSPQVLVVYAFSQPSFAVA
jgi:hypothetical protein